MSIEGTANTEYASLSGKIRTFVVDKSLTVSGACADAKATGDRFNGLQEAVTEDAVAAAMMAAEEYVGGMPVPDQLYVLREEIMTTTMELVGERAKVVCGSYVGTGTVGADNPNKITVDFEPKMLALVTEAKGGAYVTGLDLVWFARPSTYGSRFYHSNIETTSYTTRCAWANNSVSWWVEGQGSAERQCNAEGVTYHYIAFG